MRIPEGTPPDGLSLEDCKKYYPLGEKNPKSREVKIDGVKPGMIFRKMSTEGTKDYIVKKVSGELTVCDEITTLDGKVTTRVGQILTISNLIDKEKFEVLPD